MSRGRKKDYSEEDKPRKLEYKFDNHDGTFMIAKYDFDKNPNGGLISTEIIGERIQTEAIPEPKSTKKLPKTQQKYINPKNGKEVSYQRAKQLGII